MATKRDRQAADYRAEATAQGVSAVASSAPAGDSGQGSRIEAASGGNRPETPDGSSQAAKTELPTG
jgi:hypothetical protein